MPAEFLVPLVAVAFLVVLTLFVVGLVVYLRIVRRLKDRNSPLVASGDRSSRWALWRFLWTQQDRDHSMGSLLKTFRIVSIAYMLAVVVLLVVVAMVLLPR